MRRQPRRSCIGVMSTTNSLLQKMRWRRSLLSGIQGRRKWIPKGREISKAKTLLSPSQWCRSVRERRRSDTRVEREGISSESNSLGSLLLRRMYNKTRRKKSRRKLTKKEKNSKNQKTRTEPSKSWLKRPSLECRFRVKSKKKKEKRGKTEETKPGKSQFRAKDMRSSIKEMPSHA